MSPRRLTGSEETAILQASRKLEAAQGRVDQLLAERDELIARAIEAGARVTDIANVLGITRATVHAAFERSRGTTVRSIRES